MTQEQLLGFRPNLKPRGQTGEPFIAVSALPEPADFPVCVGVEWRFHQIKINPQWPVEFGGKAMPHDLEDRAGEHGQVQP